MKEKPLQSYRLSKAKKLLLCSLIFLLEICSLLIIIAAFLKGYNTTGYIVSFWFLVNIFTFVQCLISQISIYSDYCIVKSWNHPAGLQIPLSSISEVYFRHATMFNNQRIVIKYADVTNKQKEIVVLCDESDYIDDMASLLNPQTKVRKY